MRDSPLLAKATSDHMLKSRVLITFSKFNAESSAMQGSNVVMARLTREDNWVLPRRNNKLRATNTKESDWVICSRVLLKIAATARLMHAKNKILQISLRLANTKLLRFSWDMK